MTIELFNGTTYADSLVWANSVSNGAFFYGFLLVVMTVILMGTMRWGATLDRALLATTLVGFITTAIFTIIGVVGSRDFLIMLFLLSFSFMWSYHS